MQDTSSDKGRDAKNVACRPFEPAKRNFLFSSSASFRVQVAGMQLELGNIFDDNFFFRLGLSFRLPSSRAL